MGVERGLHCRDTKSVLWWENTVEGDSLEDQSKVVAILKWIERSMTFACRLICLSSYWDQLQNAVNTVVNLGF